LVCEGNLSSLFQRFFCRNWEFKRSGRLWTDKKGVYSPIEELQTMKIILLSSDWENTFFFEFSFRLEKFSKEFFSLVRWKLEQKTSFLFFDDFSELFFSSYFWIFSKLFFSLKILSVVILVVWHKIFSLFFFSQLFRHFPSQIHEKTFLSKSSRNESETILDKIRSRKLIYSIN